MGSIDTCWVLAGPTASGKTALSLQLAEKHHCEIICMDSMQIYQKMNIGTAKPTAEEQRRAKHHMLDVLYPTDTYSVAQYQAHAEQIAREIINRGNQPLFVGGTGLYLRALRHPMAMGEVIGDAGIRKRLENIADSEDGRKLLHQRLAECDPETASKVHYNNVRRVVRALEVYELTGKPFSMQPQLPDTPAFHYRVAMLEFDRAILYQRIEKRVDDMIEKGLVEEVASLLQLGIPKNSQAMQAIGYKELIPYIEGQYTLQKAVYDIKLNTRHYAKRQLTWMRREENVLRVDGMSKTCFQQIEEWFTEGRDTTCQ